MPGTPTPILGLAVPTFDGDVVTWGNELNVNMSIIDSLGANAVSSSSVGRTFAYGIASPFSRAYETGGAGGITDVLPSAVGHAGQGFMVKKVDSGVGSVRISTSLGQTILDIGGPISSYFLVNYGQFVWLESDGSQWQVIGGN